MLTRSLTPYLIFSREKWCHFRQDTPLTLTEQDLEKLHGQTEVVSLKEVAEIYLPLSRLLSFYVTVKQDLHVATGKFLGTPEPKVPYVIGIAGSVAVGKSTTSRVLQALLSRWPNHPCVEIITTDGFLYPNAKLEADGLMRRKGFPESYNTPLLLQVLYEIKSGKQGVKIPIYSHHKYDVVADQFDTINQPDIVMVEGLNILQTGAKNNEQPQLFVSDFFDFSLFVDAKTDVIKQWFINRVLAFRESSFQDSSAYFNYLAKMSKTEVVKFAENIWHEINEVNLIKNILPFRSRAHLILKKGQGHAVEEVYLRKL